MDIITLSVAKKYVDDTLQGTGAIKGEKGEAGFSPVITENTGNNESTYKLDIQTANGKLTTPNLKGVGNFTGRWEYKYTEFYLTQCWNYDTKQLKDMGALYSCMKYVFNGEKQVRISGVDTGTWQCVAYCFVDENNDVISMAEYVKGTTYKNLVLNVPSNAYALYVNGNNYASAYIEVLTEDTMGDTRYLPYLLTNFGKKLQYKEEFQWKEIPEPLIAFTFDDSLPSTSDIIDLFISKGVPCCFGAIPELLNMGVNSGETLAQAMQRGVDAVGCEVLAHGNSGYEIVTDENIDDMNFLYNKFVVNKQKFLDHGFNVRGVVRVGGSGNICFDKRTDEWVRLFFDYGDAYGINEPQNHPRVSSGSSIEADKASIDKAIANKGFTSLLFHQPPEYLGELIDYAIEKGARICNYAYAYDTYGSTKKEVSILNRLDAIEKANGNEVVY